jgi:hypothetical protein
LTSLRQYIDYQRSYPNADGNLLNSKPLFYDDGDNTRIFLFFAKAYAVHFFHHWSPLDTLPSFTNRKGMLKIVIKDPREDIEIINPPSLDSIINTVEIPQTQEIFVDDPADPNAPIPFISGSKLHPQPNNHYKPCHAARGSSAQETKAFKTLHCDCQ